MDKVDWRYVIAAIIAAITAGLSVRRINKQKSFELLTKERLNQLESIRSVIKRLKLLTSASYICMLHRKRISAYSYELMLEKVKNDLAESLTSIEKQEKSIFEEIDVLQENAIRYYKRSTSISRIKLEKQQEILFLLLEIYDWSLWQYIQDLHKCRQINFKRNLTLCFLIII